MQKRGGCFVKFLLRLVRAQISKEDHGHSRHDEPFKDGRQAVGSGRTDRSRELAWVSARMPAGSEKQSGCTGAPLGGMLLCNRSSEQKRGHGISSDNVTSSNIPSNMGAQIRVMRMTGQTLNTGWVEQDLSTPLCVQNMVSPLWFSVFLIYFFLPKVDAYLSISLCLNLFCFILGFLRFVFKLD